MYWLKNLDTGERWAKFSKQELLDSIPPTVPAGAQACRWLCALDGWPSEAAYFKAKVAGIWKLYTAECSTCVRIYQPNVTAIQTWVGNRLPEGVNVDYEFDCISAELSPITPGGSDTETVFTIDLSAFGGGTDFYLTGISARIGGSGTINEIDIYDHSPVVVRWGTFVAPAAANYVNQTLTSPHKLAKLTDVSVFHSAIASGTVELMLNIKIKG